MRPKNHFPGPILLLAPFLLLWGCIEYVITTQVMPDGKILRNVTVKGDSSDIFRGSFRVPSDSTWTIHTRYEESTGKDSARGTVYVYEAIKEFQDYRELNSYFFRDSAFSDHLITHIKLTRHNKGFYRYFEYNETYTRLFPFGKVPIHDYLTDSQVRVYLSGEEEIYYSPEKDSLMLAPDQTGLPVMKAADSARFKQLQEELDLKFETWQKTCIYNDLYEVVSQALGDMERSADTVKGRDAFYQWLDSMKVFESVKDNSEAFVDAAAAFYSIDPSTLMAANQGGFDDFSRKFKVPALSPESFSNQVLLPGMIIHANTDNVKGNLASWELKIGDFYASDYVMTVHSRMVNKIAIVIAGIILVLLVGLVLIRMSGT